MRLEDPELVELDLRSDAAGVKAYGNDVIVQGSAIISMNSWSAGNQNVNTQVLGVSEDYVDIRSWPLVAGVNFTETDTRNANKVGMIAARTRGSGRRSRRAVLVARPVDSARSRGRDGKAVGQGCSGNNPGTKWN